MNRADVPDKLKDSNLMNQLVPYLDLYGRLSDEELARLTSVPEAVVANLRRQVVQVDRALARFTDLLPRLTDAEMVRLTGATPKTIRFWRLCQPRFGIAGAEGEGWSVAQAAETLGRVGSSSELTGRPIGSGVGGSTGGTGGAATSRTSGEIPLESGIPLDQHPTGELPRQGSGPYQAAESWGDGRVESRRRSTSDAIMSGESTRRHKAAEVPRKNTNSSAGSSAYRMPASERDGGPRAGAVPGWAPRGPSRVDLSKPKPAAAGKAPKAPKIPKVKAPKIKAPRTGSTQEIPAAAATPPVPSDSPEHPDARLKQKAVAKQMAFDGAPFPGNDAEASGTREDDGIFIGLELPDPRTLAQPGRRD